MTSSPALTLEYSLIDTSSSRYFALTLVLTEIKLPEVFLARTGEYSSTTGPLDSSLLTFLISLDCVDCYAVERVRSLGGRTFVI